jgi:FixJ family two-component response regulator
MHCCPQMGSTGAARTGNLKVLTPSLKALGPGVCVRLVMKPPIRGHCFRTRRRANWARTKSREIWHLHPLVLLAQPMHSGVQLRPDVPGSREGLGLPRELIMGDVTEVVFVIDDDPSMRAAIEDLIGSVALPVRPFASPQEFLASKRPDAPGCLVLDVRLPGMSGLTFQTELAKAGVDLPVIFITGHGDIRMSVRAMKAGAIEFLTKPFQDQDLLDAVHAAIQRHRERRREAVLVSELRERYATLTERERQIMTLVVAGRANKQIAAELELSEMTVKVHRGQVMRKMQAGSLAQLVRIADRLAALTAAS